MPESEIRKRGGATKYRTIKINGKTYKVAVVRKKGPRGGHTVAWRNNG
jgi:hypothetical protein